MKLLRNIVLCLFCSISLHSSELTLEERFIYTKNYQANLISSISPNSKKAVLYIHGFNDYFFNKEFAQNFLDRGYSFFAIDLHNYGKNIKENTKKYYFTDVKEFYPEINKAIDIMRSEHKIENITLYGISQGALIAALYENDNKKVNQLILDSPFFDHNTNWFLESIAIPLVAKIGSFFPELKLESEEENIFGKTIHKDYYGEWDINLKYKDVKTNATIYLGWLNAIHQAQQKLQKGLDIKVPSLVLSSNNSSEEQLNPKYYHNSDIVLDVKEIQKYSLQLSKNKSFITNKIIPNAMHGVLISPKHVRQKAYEEIFKWLDN